MKAMSMQNDASARMIPMVTAPPAGNQGYDMQPPYPDVHGMQGFPYAQPQSQQYMAWQFAQQQAAQHPHMQPFDFGGMTQGRAPGLEEERLKFQFPVSVFSIYVFTTGMFRLLLSLCTNNLVVCKPDTHVQQYISRRTFVQQCLSRHTTSAQQYLPQETFAQQ
jgi:hypothetical protein